MKIGYLITCEHGSNRVPKKYAALFANNTQLLHTHAGWDIGSLEIYTALCKGLPVEKQQAKWSRLLIELNRSLHHRHLFSSITSHLSKEEKNILIQEIYLPYRQEIQHKIKSLLAKNSRVIHLAVHSFTPVFNSIQRSADIGLLYDPRRSLERDYCYGLKRHIQSCLPEYTVRMNYPYKGYSDGLTTSLRSQFSPKQYFGIEFEINQKFLKNKRAAKIFVPLLANVVRDYISSYITT